MALAAQRGKQAREHAARHGLDARLLARAAQDGGREALGMPREVDARDEAAHRVAKHHVTRSRIALADPLAQGVDVLDEHVLPRLERHVAQVVYRTGRLAMAHVVVGTHDKPMGHEKLRERRVALDVLGHAVDELDDGAGREVRPGRVVGLPNEGAYDRGAVMAGIGERGGLHGASLDARRQARRVRGGYIPTPCPTAICFTRATGPPRAGTSRLRHA